MASMQDVEHAVGEDDATGGAGTPGGSLGMRSDLRRRCAGPGQRGSSTFGLKRSSLMPKIGSFTFSVYSAEIVMVFGRPRI